MRSALLLLILPLHALAACITCAAGKYCLSSTCTSCPLGFFCTGGATAQPTACVPFSACPATGLSAQQPCAWSTVNYVGTGVAGSLDTWWTSATLSAPLGIATGPNSLNGVVLVSSGHAIRNATGSSVYTMAGVAGTSGNVGGAAGTNALFSGPTRMALTSGTPLYVADTQNNALKTVACACKRVCCVCCVPREVVASDDLQNARCVLYDMHLNTLSCQRPPPCADTPHPPWLKGATPSHPSPYSFLSKHWQTLAPCRSPPWRAALHPLALAEWLTPLALPHASLA